MLRAFFTDSSAHSPLGRLATSMGRLAPRSARRLASRKPHGVSKYRVWSNDRMLALHALHRLAGRAMTEESKWCEVMSASMMRWYRKIEQPTHIYNMYCENLDFIREVKRDGGPKVITDVYVNPLAFGLVQEEARRLGFLNHTQHGIQSVSRATVREAFRLSDILLCPSGHVADGVLELDNSLADKVRICPYGYTPMRDTGIEIPREPWVLWAGRDWLRKGLHRFGEVATLVRRTVPGIRFIVAGVNDPRLSADPRLNDVEFLGELPPEELARLYRSVSCFLLPSIAEGLAGVCVEAASFGCPVICSPQSGLDEAPRFGGQIVKTNDIAGMADAVIRLATKPAARQAAVAANREMVDFYSESAWKHRLLEHFE